MTSSSSTMTMPFDVCERFIDRLLGIFPSITREQAKEYVASIDEVVTIAETKAEERITISIEQKLQSKIKLEIKESDIATGKDLLLLDSKIEKEISKSKISIIMWMVIVTISSMLAFAGILITFLSWKLK